MLSTISPPAALDCATGTTAISAEAMKCENGGNYNKHCQGTGAGSHMGERRRVRRTEEQQKDIQTHASATER